MQRVAYSTPSAESRLKATRIDKVLASISDSSSDGAAFEVRLPGRSRQRFGSGQPAFQLIVRNTRGMSALASLDERRIGEAYLDGDLDLDGDMVAALSLRAGLTDKHPLTRLWSVYGHRLLFGQVTSDKKWIHEHYDEDPDFYLTFLDTTARCYSHGYFERDDEILEVAIQRKLGTAMEACRMRHGWRVLDIGAGWGAFTEHAGQRGIHVTSLTISAESERYVSELIARQGLPCRVLREHFLEHRPDEPYDAIVNLGVTEHLPDYAATLAQYQRLLKPGGRVFLDACATRSKFSLSSFVLSHVWPGNGTPMQLSDYLREVERTPFELVYARNDRHNYELTARHWAERLDRSRDEIVQRWGERVYRRFRLFFWGCVHSFSTDDVTAYRMLLESPQGGRNKNQQGQRVTR